MTLKTEYTSELLDATFFDDGAMISAPQKVYKYDDVVTYEIRRLVFPTHAKEKKRGLD